MKTIVSVILLQLICLSAYADLLTGVRAMMKAKANRDSVFIHKIKEDSLLSISGDKDAQYRYGVYCYFNNRKSEGIQLLKKSAQKFNPHSLRMIGELEYYGEGLEKNQTNAFIKFQKAASLKDSLALCYIGICKYYGNGTIKDYKIAFDYFTRAYKCSNPYIRCLSSYYIAKCFRYGRGTSKNIDISNLITLENCVAATLGNKVLSEILYDYDVSLELYEKDLLTPKQIPSAYLSSTPDNTIRAGLFLNNNQLLDLRNDVDGNTVIYYHIISTNGQKVETCEENRLLFTHYGVKYRKNGSLNTLVSFKKQMSHKLSVMQPGTETFETSDGGKCAITVVADTDFTNKVTFDISGKAKYTFIVSKQALYMYADPSYRYRSLVVG